MRDGLARVRSAGGRIVRCCRPDPGLALRMFGWRLSVPVLKRCLPIGALAQMMWKAPRSSASRDLTLQVARIRELALSGGRVLAGRNCLTRSLVLYRLLSHAGANPCLLLGAKRACDKTDGHAWIEVGGEPFPEADGHEYEPLVCFQARAAAPHSGRMHRRPA